MLKLEKDRYSHKKLIPGITWIYDGINDSTYVDESEDSAFVIDTGMRDESLTDYIRKNITDKPLTLVVTHGHLDHSMHVAEFDRFYMSAKDDYLVPEKAHADFSKRINIQGGDIIRIPGLDLAVVDSAGHTPGSVSFVDRTHRAVFHGDAFSNGANVWMQLPGCSDLSAYRDSILSAVAAMKKYGVDDSWIFPGGHYEQKFGFPDPRYQPNEPGILLMEHMAQLCQKLINGEIVGEFVPEMDRFGDRFYSARYEKAWMLYTLKQVK